jgi:hypothetical protein
MAARNIRGFLAPGDALFDIGLRALVSSLGGDLEGRHRGKRGDALCAMRGGDELRAGGRLLVQGIAAPSHAPKQYLYRATSPRGGRGDGLPLPGVSRARFALARAARRACRLSARSTRRRAGLHTGSEDFFAGLLDGVYS